MKSVYDIWVIRIFDLKNLFLAIQNPENISHFSFLFPFDFQFHPEILKEFNSCKQILTQKFTQLKFLHLNLFGMEIKAQNKSNPNNNNKVNQIL